MKYLVVKNQNPLCYGNGDFFIFSSHQDSFPVVCDLQEAQKLANKYGGEVQPSERFTAITQS